MRYLSVCSGIEAATVAWRHLGWTPKAFAEVEAFPSAVLAHRFPGVPNVGDFTAIRDADHPDVQILVGGTPCTSFSRVGKRTALGCPEGSLSLSFMRLARELPDLRYLVWENVPDVLELQNSFGRIVGELVCGEPIPAPPGGEWPRAGLVRGPWGTAAWRVLNAEHFGVPQRRRRLFLIASPRASGSDPARVLFEPGDALGRIPPDGPEIPATLANSRVLDQPLSPGSFPEWEHAAFSTFGRTMSWVAPTLTAADAVKSECGYASPQGLRRWTPVERERLQGFPDNWTAIPWRGKPAYACPAGHRGKAVGNSMPVPVMRWIGERIAAEEARCASLRKAA